MRIAVVGLGYVGSPLARAFAAAGEDVVGIDVDARRAEAATSQGVPSGTEPSLAAGADAVILCLPTPLTANREPDLSAVRSGARAVAPHLGPGTLVVLESTSYPGTTRERVVPLLEEGSGLRAGGDLHVAYSPERLDPGRDEAELLRTPKLIAGLTPGCAQRAQELYGRVFETLVPVSTPEAAEFTKLLENIFRAVNIALVNELAVLADRMGLDIWEMVEAATTKPYGFMPFHPGPGMGGHCLPVDPFYLSWRAREFGVPTEFIELAGKINQRMPDHCVERVQRALNDHGLAVRGSRVLLLGVSYKAGIGDVRESPALRIAERLRALGAELGYHDPHVPDPPAPGLRALALDDGLTWADVVVIVTAHPEVEHADVARRARLTVDLRGVTRGAGVPGVVRL